MGVLDHVTLPLPHRGHRRRRPLHTAPAPESVFNLMPGLRHRADRTSPPTQSQLPSSLCIPVPFPPLPQATCTREATILSKGTNPDAPLSASLPHALAASGLRGCPASSALSLFLQTGSFSASRLSASSSTCSEETPEHTPHSTLSHSAQ